MKRLGFLIPLVAVALASCATLPSGTTPAAIPIVVADATLPPPVTAANLTTIDEQVVLTAERAYKGWRIAIEASVDIGALKGTNASRAAGLDNSLYAALAVMRTAYRTGNAASYDRASKEFNSLADHLAGIIGSKSK